MRGTLIFGLLLFTVAAVGCGGGGSGDGDDDGTDGDAAVDSPIPSDFVRLIGRTWSLQPGATDTYRCVRLTLTEDTYITSFMAQAPQGTHHTVVSIVSNNVAGPDGEYNCDVGELGTQMLYASGVGTSPLDFPANVGLRIPAGTQIHLNLHLYNASDAPLSGDTVIMVRKVAAAPPMLAEMVFAGKIIFSISGRPEDQPVEISGGCTVQQPYTLFATWPHMHQLAVHQKIELIRGGSPTVLHDGAYSFLEQEYYLEEPFVNVQAGDQIRVTCRYNNTTGGSVSFGESSDNEMCFGGLYRFPAQNSGLFQCTDVPGGVPF